MVEVFKTNITDSSIAAELTEVLYAKYPNGRINFDLEDCDNILRVESEKVVPHDIMYLFASRGFQCQLLD